MEWYCCNIDIVSSRHRRNLLRWYRDDIFCKGTSYRHHFDVATMTMIFSKKTNFLTISILCLHDIAATYWDDIVTISLQRNVVPTSFRCCYYDDDFSKKTNFLTISISTSPQLIEMISWRYLCKGTSYRHHFDVATMTMIFSKKKTNFLTISILCRHDIAATYWDDIVMISSQRNVVSTLLLWWWFFQFFTISILRRHDIVATYWLSSLLRITTLIRHFCNFEP